MSYGASSFGASSYGSSGDKLKRLSVIYNLDAAILKSKTSAFILDSFIVWCTQPGGSGTTTIRYNVPYTINACLLKTKNNIFTLDAKLIRFINFEINSYLQKTNTSQHTIDALIVYNTKRCPGAVVTSDDIIIGTIYRTDGIKNW